MTKYVSGIVQRASPNVGEGRIRPEGRSLGTPGLDLFTLAHGNLYEHTWLDLAKKKLRGTNLRFIKKCLRISHSWRVHTLE